MEGGAWWAALRGVAKSRTQLSDFSFTFHFHALEKEMATHSSVLAWRIPGMGEPDGLPSMGSYRVGHNWSDLAAAAVVITTNLEAYKVTYVIVGQASAYFEVLGRICSQVPSGCLHEPCADAGVEARFLVGSHVLLPHSFSPSSQQHVPSFSDFRSLCLLFCLLLALILCCDNHRKFSASLNGVCDQIIIGLKACGVLFPWAGTESTPLH